jgi:transcriptional regulator with XRE-family HTH domain
MTKLIPLDPSAKPGHRSVAEMARDLLADDPDFVAELDSRLADRQLVKSLAVIRARAGLSQQELAAKMGCSQSKISKLENGLDADVRFADITAYLQATNHEAKIFVVPAGGTLIDEVKMHAFQIKQSLDRMVELAGTDGAITKGVAAFIEEAACNLARITRMAGQALPHLPPEPSRPVHVATPEPEMGDDTDAEDTSRRKDRPALGRAPASEKAHSNC